MAARRNISGKGHPETIDLSRATSSDLLYITGWSESKIPRKIRAELALRGINQSEIARQLGVSSQMVCQVIAGRAISARVTNALIEAGVPAKLFKETAG